MINIKLIEQLTNAWGVSGNENQVRKLIRQQIEKHVDDIRVDAVGNLIAHKKAKGSKRNPLKVMIAGHMDEIGLMVTHIDKSGYLKFHKVGGIDDRILLAKRVLVGNDRVPGVIGVRPIHMLARKGEHRKVSSYEELLIDIGASSQEEAERWVKAGDYVMFDTACEDWGKNLKGKAFDDRIGCYLMIELLKQRYSFDLYAAFTTQEEIGLRGGRVAAYHTLPDMAFVLEGTGAGDFPQQDNKDVSKVPALGKGPVVTITDRTVICDKGLVKLLLDTARAKRIPVQIKRPGIGGTDAGRIHITREGVRTAVVAVPTRYIHSPSCLINKQDIAAALKLMQEALKKVR
jgi:endoglucanase